jgi:5,10-methylenetetrahydromethanopterin reductase
VVAVSVAVQTDKPVGDYARLAVQAEELGFDGVSTFHDLGFQPSLFALLEMARATTRVRLGAACLNPNLLHPYEIAGQVAALDLASDGRAYLGLARGAWLGEVGVRPSRPLQRMAETVEIVRRLLRGDESPYAGESFSLAAGTRLRYARRRERVDVLLGTWGPRGLALAAGIADEVKLGGSANPDMVRHARGLVSDAADAAGRAPSDIGVVAGAVTVVDEDGAAARAHARVEVAMYLDVVAALDVTVTVPDEVLVPLRAALAAGDGAAAGACVPDELLDRFAFAGSPDQVARHAADVAAAGASRIEFGTPHGLRDAHGIDLLGRHVLPALKELP